MTGPDGPAARLPARWVLTMDGPPLRDATVVLRGDRVLAVEPTGPGVAPVCDVVLPGMVNAHAHLEYGAPFADLARAGLPLPQWVPRLVERRRTLTDDDVLATARAGVAALLRAGTTGVGDVVTVGPGLRAAAEAGLTGVSYVESVALDTAGWEARGREALIAALAAAEQTVVGSARGVGVSPHALYTLDSAAFRGAVAVARDRGLRLHTHLAETADEAEFVLSGTGAWAELARRVGLDHDLLARGSGRTPTQHLAALGGLGPDVHVAHGVHVTAPDRALLREASTAVALCVRSNALLAAGTPPVAALLGDGVPLALGTDSLASSPDLDLLAEARAVAALAREQGYRGADLAERLVRAATAGGAHALGIGEAGRIRPGGRADLALLDCDGPRDGSDPYGLVLAAGRCVATVLGGRAAFGSARVPGVAPVPRLA